MKIFSFNKISWPVFSHVDYRFLTVFWLMVAALTLLQDFLYAGWKGSYFSLGESLAFKTFWLFYIPFTFIYYFLYRAFLARRTDDASYLIISFALVLGTAFLHLLLFSLALSLCSQFMHSRPWEFTWLLEKKLTTHLVYAVAVYTMLSYFGYRSSKRRTRGRKYLQNLSVKNGTRTTLIPVNEITHIMAAGAYLEVYTGNRKYVVVSTLKEMLGNLDPACFRRIHKSAIINLESVSEIKSRLTGDYDLITREGETLRLSRNYAREFKERFS